MVEVGCFCGVLKGMVVSPGEGDWEVTGPGRSGVGSQEPWLRELAAQVPAGRSLG